MNVIALLGRTTADLELKTTSTGKSVCTFTLAVNRPFAKDVTDFIPCTVWNKTAEIMVNYIKKGQLIGIDGYLSTRKYQDKDGNNRTAYEVNVNNFHFAESKKLTNDRDPLDNFEKQINESELNKTQYNNSSNSFNFIEDDDIPF